MSERDARMPDGASQAQLIAQLEELGQDGLEAVLGDLAAALFPAGTGTFPQLTWPGAVVDRSAAEIDQPPIDEAAAAAARMRAAELRYTTLVEQIPAITFTAMLGDGKNEIYVSPHIEAVLGFPQHEWLENPFLWYTQLHPDDRALWIAEFARGCRTGGPFRAECRFIARDSRIVWLRGEARLIKDDHGRPSFLQGIAYDITDSKAAQAVVLQQAVSTTEQRYRDLVERIGAIFWEVDPQSGNFTFVSQGTDEILRFSRDRWLADPRFWLDQVHAEDRAYVAAVWEQALKEGGDHEIDFRAITSDGQTRWLHNKVHVPYAADGDARALGVILDVTERKRTEEELATTRAREQRARAEIAAINERRLAAEALHASEEKYRLIVDSAHEGIWLLDADARGEFVNRRMTEILGYTSEELVGRSFLDFVDPAARADAESRLDRDKTGISEDYDLIFRRKDGSEVWAILSATPVFQGGIYVGALKMVLDVTERRRLEDNLRQAQKMDAVGQLAGGVAHDFNNLLTAILGFSELAQAALPADDPIRSDIDEIRRAGESASALTRQLLAFSRKQFLQPRVVDLNDVVRGMQKMLGRLIGEHIELRVTVVPGSGVVKVDPGQIEQVILNLAVNARDAMPNGGALTIEKADVDVDAAHASRYLGMVPGRYVMLAIGDSGTGMTPETKARLFEPFFTTKDQGKGTGLGLATVYGIVKQSGGYVSVDSEIGVGSKFSVYLPRVEEEVEQPLPDVAPAPIRGNEVILLVEDHPAVRRLAREALERAGYTVLQAADGDEAFELSARHHGQIDLLLTDVVMPRISGQAVAARLTVEREGLKVLFMSGYADNAVVRVGLLDRSTAFLHKPFTSAVLTNKVRELLDAK